MKVYLQPLGLFYVDEEWRAIETEKPIDLKTKWKFVGIRSTKIHTFIPAEKVYYMLQHKHKIDWGYFRTFNKFEGYWELCLDIGDGQKRYWPRKINEITLYNKQEAL